MVWYPAYLDKEDIVEVVGTQRPRFATGDVLNVNLRLADTAIFAMLNDENITINYTGTVSGNAVSPADINSYLWGASLCFNLEFMGYEGQAQYSPGGIQQSKHGGIQQTFMRMQPMFFLGQGDLKNMDKVMPFRSWKQLGQWFVQKWIDAYNLNRYGTRISAPIVESDDSSRGWGWNADTSFISGADALSSGLN